MTVSTSHAPQRAEEALGLICDADDVSARVLARALESLRLRSTVCGSAADCEALIARERPAVLLLSVLLPDADGLAVTRRLRARGETLPIVMVSALRAAGRALEAGAQAFLIKPVAFAELAATVKQLLPEEMPA